MRYRKESACKNWWFYHAGNDYYANRPDYRDRGRKLPTITVHKIPGVLSVVAKKLGCRLKIKLRRLKEGLKYLLCFTDSSPGKNPAGNRRFFSQ